MKKVKQGLHDRSSKLITQKMQQGKLILPDETMRSLTEAINKVFSEIQEQDARAYEQKKKEAK